jgi:asparagine synthase (glutamine-hydrolysing)
MTYLGYCGANVTETMMSWISQINSWNKKSVLIKYISDFCFWGLLDFRANETEIIYDDKPLSHYIDGFLRYEDEEINSNNAPQFCETIYNLTQNAIENNVKVQGGNFTYFSINQSEIVFVNDYYGTRPFYYYIDTKGNLYFTNDIRTLLVNQSIPFEADIGSCMKYCSSSFTVDESTLGENTFFAHIYKLKIGSVAKYDYRSSRFIIRKYEIGLNKLCDVNDNFNDVCIKFRNILNSEVLSAYSATNNELGITLSGGIDSAVVLASALSCGMYERTFCYHLSFKNPVLYQVSDHGIVRQLLKHTNTKGCIVWGDNTLKISNCELGRDYIDHANGPTCLGNYSFYQIVSAVMRDRKSELLLGGDGGDYLFMGTKYCFDYFAAQGNIAEAIGRMHSVSRDSNLVTYIWNLISNFLSLISVKGSNIQYIVKLWTDIVNPPIPYYISGKVRNYEKELNAARVSNYNSSAFLYYWYRRFIYDMVFPKGEYVDSYVEGVSLFQPLMGLPILKFALEVPPYYHYDWYKSVKSQYLARKRILRKAYTDILPQFITQQPEKTNYAMMHTAILRNEAQHLKNIFDVNGVLITDEMELINGVEFCNEIGKVLEFTRDPHYTANLGTKSLFNIIHLELWLRLIQKGRDFYMNLCIPQSKINNCEIEFINCN